MAKQVGPIKIEGQRIGKLVFYKMRSEYYVRTKSSLNKKCVKKDPAFRRTMINAGLMGRASKIGSAIYQSLPTTWRKFWMYRSFTGEALLMLRDGMMEEEIRELMMKRYVEVKQKNTEQEKKQVVLKNEEMTKENKRMKYEVRNTIDGKKAPNLGITRVDNSRFDYRNKFISNYSFRIKESLSLHNLKRDKSTLNSGIFRSTSE